MVAVLAALSVVAVAVELSMDVVVELSRAAIRPALNSRRAFGKYTDETIECRNTSKRLTISDASILWGAASADPAREAMRGRIAKLNNIAIVRERDGVVEGN